MSTDCAVLPPQSSPAVGKPAPPADISRAVQSGIELTILKNHFIAVKPRNGVSDVSMIVSGKKKIDVVDLLKAIFTNGIVVRAGATMSVDDYVGNHLYKTHASMHAGLVALVTLSRTSVNAAAVKVCRYASVCYFRPYLTARALQVLNAHGSVTTTRLAHFGEDGTLEYVLIATSVLMHVRLVRARKIYLIRRPNF